MVRRTKHTAQAGIGGPENQEHVDKAGLDGPIIRKLGLKPGLGGSENLLWSKRGPKNQKAGLGRAKESEMSGWVVQRIKNLEIGWSTDTEARWHREAEPYE